MAVTKKDLKDLEFASIEEYFDYILQSKENGQHEQARDLYANLSDDDGMQSAGQKTAFWEYVDATYYYDAQDSFFDDFTGAYLTEMEQLKQYFKKH